MSLLEVNKPLKLVPAIKNVKKLKKTKDNKQKDRHRLKNDNLLSLDRPQLPLTDRHRLTAVYEGVRSQSKESFMDTNAVQIQLVAVIRRLADEKRADLDRHKENHVDIDRPDFLWHYLLQSFATMGQSAGWYGLIGNSDNYSRITYSALLDLPDGDRLREVREVCRAAKVRMPNRKADFIVGCFDRIRDMGGPEDAKSLLLAQSSRESKIQWLKEMPGIGDKYARNIMMDVYHEDFRNSIAVDVRIKSLSDRLGLSFQSYSEHENFYLDVATQAGLNGWELDRLLYNFLSDVLSRLQLPSSSSEQGAVPGAPSPRRKLCVK